MPQFSILFYANTILATQRGWPWHHVPPKYAPGPHNQNQQYCLYAIKPLDSCSKLETLKNLLTTLVNLDILFMITKKIRINSFTKRSANRIVACKVC